MPTYKCPVCSETRNARPNWTRSLKCKKCGTLYSTDTNRVRPGSEGHNGSASKEGK